jgi:hypothetical protein
MDEFDGTVMMVKMVMMDGDGGGWSVGGCLL